MSKYRSTIIVLIMLTVNVLFLIVFTRKQNVDIKFLESDAISEFYPYGLRLEMDKSAKKRLVSCGAKIDEIYYDPLYIFSSDNQWLWPETGISVHTVFFIDHPVVKYGQINGLRNIYEVSSDFNYGAQNEALLDEVGAF